MVGIQKTHEAQTTNGRHTDFLTHISQCNQVQGQEEYFLHENRSDYTSNIDRVVSN